MTLQLTKPIAMTDIEAEFLAPSGTPLSAFVRGGAFVPDSGANAGVPTSKPIAMTDLLGAANVQEETIALTSASGGTGREGYEFGSFGSINPTTLYSVLCTSLQTNNNELEIEVDANVGQAFWTTCVIDGPADANWNNVVFTAALADSFQTGGSTLARWRFDINDLWSDKFVQGQVYNFTFTDE